MGVTSFSFEFVCSVSAGRMFKASVLDAHNLAPKIMGQVISGAGLIEGDGGVDRSGVLSVKQFTFTEAVPFSPINEWVHMLDKDHLEYKSIVTEGADVGTKPISALCHVKFVPSNNGGCVVKATTEFTPDAWVQYTEEETTIAKEGAMEMFQAVREHLFRAVEAHLVENPDAYA